MLVCCLAITQGAWAINDVVFTETFDSIQTKVQEVKTANMMATLLQVPPSLIMKDGKLLLLAITRKCMELINV